MCAIRSRPGRKLPLMGTCGLRRCAAPARASILQRALYRYCVKMFTKSEVSWRVWRDMFLLMAT